MLYGMADAEKQALVDLGHRLRIYMPYGELIPGMAYLVRRLLENTSNDSFLRASFSEHVPAEKLLMNPLDHRQSRDGDGHLAARPAAVASPLCAGISQRAADRLQPRGESRRPCRRRWPTSRDSCGGDYPLVDRRPGGRRPAPGSRRSIPSHKTSVVGRVAAAGAEARAAGRRRGRSGACPPGRDWAPTRAAEFLRGAADVMRERRFELAAWEVYECGKPWREADADVSEAIDFCEYYAAGAIELAEPHGVDVPGEENRFEYLPRGVAVVIAPWNFPLAILTGMTTAALVTGNTVVMKPAEQSPRHRRQADGDLSARSACRRACSTICRASAKTVGAALVEHPDVAADRLHRLARASAWRSTPARREVSAAGS